MGVHDDRIILPLVIPLAPAYGLAVDAEEARLRALLTVRGIVVGVNIAVLGDAAVGRRWCEVVLRGVGWRWRGKEFICRLGVKGVVCLFEGVYPCCEGGLAW